MYNLRKILCKFLLCVLILKYLIPSAYAEGEVPQLNPSITVDDDIITISGDLGEAYGNKDVSLLMLKAGTDTSGMTPEAFMQSTYHNDQVKADDAGVYIFKIQKPVGQYDIMLSTTDAGSTYADTLTFYGNTETTVGLTLDTMGHIYYDYNNISVKADVRVAEAGSGSDVKAKITLTEDSNEIYNKDFQIILDAAGNCKASHNISLVDGEKQFGIFNLKYELYIDNVKITDAATRISVVNIPKDGALNSKIGIVQHYTEDGRLQDYYGLSDIAGMEGLFAKSGFSTTRTDITWHTFEKSVGVYKLTNQLGQFYAAAKAENITPFMIIGTDNDLYRSKSPTTGRPGTNVELEDHSDPDYLKAFGDYAYNAVLKTKESYGEGVSYEIYNEYNIKQFNVLNSDGTTNNEAEKKNATPEGYANLLKVAYARIKGDVNCADPEAKVYGMATAHVINDDRSDYSTYEWLEELLKIEGVTECLDGISVHMYTQSKRPEESENASGVPSSDKAAILAEYREIIDRYVPGMPIIISEVGYSSNDSIATYDPIFGTEDTSTPEVKQAKYTLRDMIRLYDGAEKIIWYNSIEKPTSSSYEHHLGFIRMENPWTGTNSNSEPISYNPEIPYEAKPVFLVMSNFNALLSDAVLVNKTENNKTYDYEFKTTEGKTVHVLWKSEESYTTSKNLALGMNYVKRYDMYGNMTELTSDTGVYNIPLTSEPIYIEIPLDYEISLTNQNGMGLGDKLTPETTSVTAVLNCMNEPKGEIMVLAVYKDNVLTEVKVGVNNSPDGLQLSAGVANVDCVKVFVLDEKGRFSPLTKNKALTK